MVRIKISVICLVFVLVFSIVGYVLLNNSCEKLASSLDDVVNAVQANETSNLPNLVDRCIELWYKEERLISLLVDHREIDEIEETLKSLPVFIDQENFDKLQENSYIAAERVRHISSKEKFSIENIF